MMKGSWYFFICCFIIVFCSCDKGYEVRFTNFYLEPMDSVIIGDPKVTFTNIELETTTHYQKIGRGDHSIRMVTRSKKVFFGVIPIPGSGTGKRTIQVDGIKQVSILED